MNLSVAERASELRARPVSGLLPLARPGVTAAALGASAVVLGLALLVQPALAVAALAALLVLLWGLHRPEQLMIAGLVLVPLTSGLRRGLVVPGVKPWELVALGVGVIVLARLGLGGSRRPDLLDAAVLGYVVVNALAGASALLVHPQPLDGVAVGVLVGPVPYAVLYFATRSAIRTPQRLRHALAALLLTSLPLSLLSLLQYLDVANLRATLISLTGSLTAPGAELESSSGRVTSLFPHWHELAGYSAVIVVLCVALLVRPTQRVLPLALMVPVLAGALISLLLSVTLVSILGTAAMVGWIVLRHRRAAGGAPLVLLAAVVPIGVVVAGAQVTERFGSQYTATPPVYELAQQSIPFLPQTVAYRVQVWVEQYLPAVAASPLVGWGPVLPDSIHWRYTESVYLTMVMRGGLLLLGAYALLVLAGWRQARRVPPTAGVESQALGEVVVCVSVAFALMQVINPYFTAVGFPHLLWPLLAMLPSAAARIRDPDRSPIERTS